MRGQIRHNESILLCSFIFSSGCLREIMLLKPLFKLKIEKEHRLDGLTLQEFLFLKYSHVS